VAAPFSTNRRRPADAWRVLGAFASVVALTAAAGCGGFVAQARNAEGVRLYQQCRYQDALREFQEAIYADPKNADGYYNLAAAHHQMGIRERCASDLKQAEKYYNDCLDRDPNHVDCHRGLAVLLAEQGRRAEAFRLLQGWVDRRPDSADAKVELARLHEEFGNRLAARDYLVEALQVQPDNPRALTALGKLREDAGELAQALANYERSLARDNRQPQVAARVKSLQTGLATGGAADGGLAAPSVDIGTRVADRSTDAPK